ncbi:hypothetical protein FKM82_016316 [Ascaphus truei]
MSLLQCHTMTDPNEAKQTSLFLLLPLSTGASICRDQEQISGRKCEASRNSSFTCFPRCTIQRCLAPSSDRIALMRRETY